jgi:hypothetical protein
MSLSEIEHNASAMKAATFKNCIQCAAINNYVPELAFISLPDTSVGATNDIVGMEVTLEIGREEWRGVRERTEKRESGCVK